MEQVHQNSSVQRVKSTLADLGIVSDIKALSDSARTAREAADALGILVGQVASSIVFKLPDNSPLLVITSGRHRVNTELVAAQLGVEKLQRVDADYVKAASGFSIGGVSPVGWTTPPGITVIDETLGDYDEVWAAAGHPHAVYPTTFEELVRTTHAKPMIVAED